MFEWDWELSDQANKEQIPLLTTKPSVIQHIGISGLNSKASHYDIAKDFLVIEKANYPLDE